MMLEKSKSYFFPNPFDAHGTLGDSAKSVNTLSHGFSLLQELWRKLSLLIVLAVFFNFVNLPWWLYWLAVICTVVTLSLGVKAFKTLRRQQAENTSHGIVGPFIIARRYQVTSEALNTPSTIILLLLPVNIFFMQNYYEISAAIESVIYLMTSSIVIMVSGINYLIGASEIKGYEKASNINDSGEAMKMMEIVKTKIQLVKFMILVPFILVLFVAIAFIIIQSGTLIQGSTAGGLAAVAVMCFSILAFPLLDIIRIRRMASVKLQPGYVDTPPKKQSPPGSIEHTETSLSSPLTHGDESIVATIAGILPNYGVIQGMQFMGKGEMKHAENSLIITDKRLVLLQVPIPGGNMMIGDIDYQSNNFYFNRGQLRENCEALLASQNLDHIISNNPKNFELNLAEIREFVLSDTSFKINTTLDKKYSYIFMDKMYREQLAAVLPDLLGNRFFIK